MSVLSWPLKILTDICRSNLHHSAQVSEPLASSYLGHERFWPHSTRLIWTTVPVVLQSIHLLWRKGPYFQMTTSVTNGSHSSDLGNYKLITRIQLNTLQDVSPGFWCGVFVINVVTHRMSHNRMSIAQGRILGLISSRKSPINIRLKVDSY
jgi:hypothetical protein